MQIVGGYGVKSRSGGLRPPQQPTILTILISVRLGAVEAGDLRYYLCRCEELLLHNLSRCLQSVGVCYGADADALCRALSLRPERS